VAAYTNLFDVVGVLVWCVHTRHTRPARLQMS